MVMMRTTLLFAALLGCSLMHPAAALIHVIGGMDGWGVPPNVTFYAEWAEPRTFGIGDEIVFPYRVGAHNVIQVAKADYDDCGHDHVVNQYYQGPTVLKLNTLGDYYFYSGIGTHCELGQKLHIKVVSGPGSSGRSYDESLDFDFGPAAAPSPTGLHIHSEDTHSAASTNAAQLLAVVSCLVLAVLFI